MDPPLTPKLIEWAYRQGAFPMAMEDGSVAWFQPDPRCIIPLDGFRVSHSLRKSARRYEVTFHRACEQVIRACSAREETWISEEFVHVYSQMVRQDQGHSAEAWSDGRLVGGVYGVALGRAFMAESMFHTETDAGKVALWQLIERLRASGFVLFDVQYMTPHLATLGAIEIAHEEYMRRLTKAMDGVVMP